MAEETNEAGTVTLKKSTLWKVGTFIFAILFVITLGHDFYESESGATGNVIAPSAPSAPSAPTVPTNVRVEIEDNDPILGDPDAPITIVEFSDFQCPFCARAFNDAVTQLKENEIKDGEVSLVYKQFPLNSIHPFAQKAGEASLCAHDQDKFWEYHDTLFANQAALSINDLKKYAADLGLDTNAFNECLDSGDKASEVNKETNQATTSGGRGTPYFIVIGEDGETVPVSGAQPYGAFQSAIQAVS